MFARSCCPPKGNAGVVPRPGVLTLVYAFARALPARDNNGVIA